MKSILVLIVCWNLVQGDDSGCLSQGGTCQEDVLQCSGHYVSGLCTGSATRRCCLHGGTGSSGTGSCHNVQIVSRSAWGATAPKSVSNLHLPVNLVFIHHTETPACHDPASCKSRVQNIQHYHISTNGWADIGYSFLVAEDGAIYEGRGWDRVGAHTEGYNQRGIAFSFIGSYSGSKPPAAALTAVKNMIQCGISLGKVASGYHLYGHRDVNPTSCPGDALYHEIQTWPHYSHTKP
ncbi:hypothetical protein CHS0354_003302 [Potamilus streckersoni]|uniref:Peptidoglycan-recognition protein n=1 Tax=Potamilus streckersoni TaxID=2493646 RepID=A0AAE0S530_9BIVA|nr:hypothetical protein CHS0354_003302 [Potamilus streckersoni]